MCSSARWVCRSSGAGDAARDHAAGFTPGRRTSCAGRWQPERRGGLNPSRCALRTGWSEATAMTSPIDLPPNPRLRRIRLSRSHSASFAVGVCIVLVEALPRRLLPQRCSMAADTRPALQDADGTGWRSAGRCAGSDRLYARARGEAVLRLDCGWSRAVGEERAAPARANRT
jgi:hypothetical protein